MSVLVVGSFVTDLVALTERAPHAGETVAGLQFNIYMGGKGANQAIAAKRMGADVAIVGCVGNDVFGKDFVDLFATEGFDVSYIKTSSQYSTGASLVTLETNGQNRICMTPGANLDYSAEELSENSVLIQKADIVVTQCEMQPQIVDKLAELCKRFGKKFILNPAPARQLNDSILASCYAITPNETELGVIVGRELISDEEFEIAAKSLLAKGVQNVIVTLGSRGSLLVNAEGTFNIPAQKVKAVDTVGAGDSFTGSLAAFLDEGKSMLEAMRLSTVVAALEVQKHGAIPSMPYRNEVNRIVESNLEKRNH